MIDYNFLSLDYDLTRDINVDTVKRILSKSNIDENSNVLDFGCGTGNYICAIKKLTNANAFGAEPSDGMRE
ncbi:MAG: class I SAM-dependent methyltransferase, partial [Clostridiales bacterium]|nr:class I SAM-dependent methyltransferase [Clostridiales bacterium]